MLASCICLAATVKAQEQAGGQPLGEEGRECRSGSWKPELGLELNSELQATHKGDYNFVNLLRLSAVLPIGRGSTFEVSTLSTCMTEGGSIGVERQTFSNIDAGNIPLALSVCGFGWQKGDSHSLFVGIRNMNEDYFCSPITSFFTQSSCGIYPTLSCNYDISNYPLASMGVHYKYNKVLGSGHNKVKQFTNDESTSMQGGDRVTLEVSLYNGTGYHRFSGRENVFRVCPQSDGIFGLAQVDYQHAGSRYFLGTSVRQQRGCGTSASPWIYTEQSVTDRLSLIAGYSHAFGSDVACSDFAGVGAHYALSKVELGIFTDYARFAGFNESTTELSCKFSVTSCVDLQPSLHLISSDGTFQTAGLLRLTVSL